MVDKLKEGIVAGDYGGDAEAIASGTPSGNFVVANKMSSYAKKSSKRDKKNRKRGKKVRDSRKSVPEK